MSRTPREDPTKKPREIRFEPRSVVARKLCSLLQQVVDGGEEFPLSSSGQEVWSSLVSLNWVEKHVMLFRLMKDAELIEYFGAIVDDVLQTGDDETPVLRRPAIRYLLRSRDEVRQRLKATQEKLEKRKRPHKESNIQRDVVVFWPKHRRNLTWPKVVERVQLHAEWSMTEQGTSFSVSTVRSAATSGKAHIEKAGLSPMTAEWADIAERFDLDPTDPGES